MSNKALIGEEPIIIPRAGEILRPISVKISPALAHPTEVGIELAAGFYALLLL
jgi:hypothetical protein